MYIMPQRNGYKGNGMVDLLLHEKYDSVDLVVQMA